MDRFRKWLGVDPEGGLSLREERLGRWIFAGVLGLLALSLAVDAEVNVAVRGALTCFLGLNTLTVTLSWIVARSAEHRRTLRSWGASLGFLLGGLLILMGLGGALPEVMAVPATHGWLWLASLGLFGLAQALTQNQWRAFGTAVRHVLDTPLGLGEPTPRSRLERHVLAIHEAGHALWEGLNPTDLTAMTLSIERDPQARPGDPGGFVDTVSVDWTWQNGVREYLEWRMLGHLAGQAAEHELTGRYFVTAGQDFKDWQKAALHLYGAWSDGPWLWREPTRSDTFEANRLLLEQIRAEQLAVLGRFFRANRAVLAELAGLVEQRGTLGLDDLKPFFARLERVPGVPELPPNEASLFESPAPSPTTTVQIAVTVENPATRAEPPVVPDTPTGASVW